MSYSIQGGLVTALKTQVSSCRPYCLIPKDDSDNTRILFFITAIGSQGRSHGLTSVVNTPTVNLGKSHSIQLITVSRISTEGHWQPSGDSSTWCWLASQPCSSSESRGTTFWCNFIFTHQVLSGKVQCFVIWHCSGHILPPVKCIEYFAICWFSWDL